MLLTLRGTLLNCFLIINSLHKICKVKQCVRAKKWTEILFENRLRAAFHDCVDRRSHGRSVSVRYRGRSVCLSCNFGNSFIWPSYQDMFVYFSKQYDHHHIEIRTFFWLCIINGGLYVKSYYVYLDDHSSIRLCSEQQIRSM